jgi:uncharacterized low-complexity protein
MKKLLFSSIMALALTTFVGCNDDKAPTPQDTKSSKCGGEKNKTMKCGSGKCGGGK